MANEVETIRAFPQPTNKRQMNRFIGMVNFYKLFIHGLASMFQSSYNALKPKKNAIVWTKEVDNTFTTAGDGQCINTLQMNRLRSKLYTQESMYRDIVNGSFEIKGIHF